MPSSRLLSISLKDLPASFEQSWCLETHWSGKTHCLLLFLVFCSICELLVLLLHIMQKHAWRPGRTCRSQQLMSRPLCCGALHILQLLCLFALYWRRRVVRRLQCQSGNMGSASCYKIHFFFLPKVCTIHKVLLWVHINFSSFSAAAAAADRDSSLFHNLNFSYIHFSFVKQFWRRAMSPGIIVIANPNIIELQSDRATPGAARTITLRPGSQWKSCIREKPQSIGCWKTVEVLADNVSIPTRAEAQRGSSSALLEGSSPRQKCNTNGFKHKKQNKTKTWTHMQVYADSPGSHRHSLCLCFKTRSSNIQSITGLTLDSGPLMFCESAFLQRLSQSAGALI